MAPPIGNARTYLRYAVNEVDIFEKIITWTLITEWKWVIQGGDHYCKRVLEVQFKGGRLSPTAGKRFLVGMSDEDSGKVASSGR